MDFLVNKAKDEAKKLVFGVDMNKNGTPDAIAVPSAKDHIDESIGNKYIYEHAKDPVVVQKDIPEAVLKLARFELQARFENMEFGKPSMDQLRVTYKELFEQSDPLYSEDEYKTYLDGKK